MSFSSPKPRGLNPLPTAYYLFFAFFEPITTLAGAIYAIFLPFTFTSTLLPLDRFPLSTTVESHSLLGLLDPTGNEARHSHGNGFLPYSWRASAGMNERALILSGSLGNTFFLLGMISFSLFPILKNSKTLGRDDHRELKEKLVWGILGPLALADVTHFIVTLAPLPLSFVLSPLQWTHELQANVGITFLLFLVRLAYFAGIGRSLSSTTTASTAAISSSGSGSISSGISKKHKTTSARRLSSSHSSTSTKLKNL